MIPAAGLGLLVLVALGIVFTGLPAFVILIGAATIGATLGVASDTVPLSLLGALPSRLINLFENDLLQALPLYVTMGLLLDRLPVADALYRAGVSLLPRRPAAPLVSGMALGALLGPMNGSVGASVLALSRVIAPRLAESGVPKPTQFAAVAVASTLGVVIPPSLVLILLGDAMLSAHTIAVTATGRADRVINTQDVFHGALDPRDRPILDLTWDYPVQGPHDEPESEAVLQEINGRAPDGKMLSTYEELKDDGSTAAGSWIHCGIFKDGVNQSACSPNVSLRS